MRHATVFIVDDESRGSQGRLDLVNPCFHVLAVLTLAALRLPHFMCRLHTQRFERLIRCTGLGPIGLTHFARERERTVGLVGNILKRLAPAACAQVVDKAHGPQHQSKQNNEQGRQLARHTRQPQQRPHESEYGDPHQHRSRMAAQVGRKAQTARVTLKRPHRDVSAE